VQKRVCIYGKTAKKEFWTKSETIPRARCYEPRSGGRFYEGTFRFERCGQIENRASREIFCCDYDTGRTAPNYRGICGVLRWLGFVPYEVQYSRTRKGWHVLIAHNGRCTPSEIVAVQFALGSDPRRETLNLMRVLRIGTAPRFWRKRFNILYSEKLR